MLNRVNEETRPRLNSVDYIIGGALAAASAALLLVVTTQIPYDQQVTKLTETNPSPTPGTQQPSSRPETPLIPLEALIAHNLKPTHPLRQFASDEAGRGQTMTIEKCQTQGSEDALAEVKVKRLNVRTLPHDQAPLETFYGQGDIVGYRLRIAMSNQENKRADTWMGIKDGNSPDLNFAAQIYRGTQYAQNLPGTTCEPVVLRETTLK